MPCRFIAKGIALQNIHEGLRYSRVLDHVYDKENVNRGAGSRGGQPAGVHVHEIREVRRGVTLAGFVGEVEELRVEEHRRRNDDAVRSDVEDIGAVISDVDVDEDELFFFWGEPDLATSSVNIHKVVVWQN